ncbi:hypothetical protein M3E13_04630 [Oceanobacillus kimchii]|uniref:hypothetical protein n=1 Tax=Oceanobacillus kimchii TaxID=746691 RepID=UPI0021A8374C|nr:hypothetical protein [Oceanobacillus kimchii]MCT1577128.1 hypothetical protein [Oceanobacillus kimchii]MCT2135198.1 hypothetical protein [Oceanobacillus kimchii]
MSANSKQTFALVGLESVGKSAIFRQLTGNQAGVETKYKRFYRRTYFWFYKRSTYD